MGARPEDMVSPASSRKFDSVEEMRRYEAESRAEAVAKQEAARLQLIKSIGLFFEKADTDGDGSLSLQELDEDLHNPDAKKSLKQLRIPISWTAQELLDYLDKG